MKESNRTIIYGTVLFLIVAFAVVLEILNKKPDAEIVYSDSRTVIIKQPDLILDTISIEFDYVSYLRDTLGWQIDVTFSYEDTLPWPSGYIDCMLAEDTTSWR